ncbi:MAG: hypothetical protein ABW068_05195 [Candidatus Thiodiazotropha sp.]
MRAELNKARSQLKASSNRDVDEVAALQASRQEMVSMQQSLSEKDHLLRLSQNQCRSLEDAIEDRDKEVDQLKRKLELLIRKTGGLEVGAVNTGRNVETDSQLSSMSVSELVDENESKRPSLGRLFRRK